MSGGERERVKAVLSEENTSSSSYSGSEPCSEFSLRSTYAGPTITSPAGKRLEPSKTGESRELSGKSHSAQQLKFYGRRKRAKQVASLQVVEGGNDRGQAEGAGLGGRLAVDLSGQLEAGTGHSCELTSDSRNGSGGFLSGRVPFGLQGSVPSRHIDMGQAPGEGPTNKDVKEAVATVDIGKTVNIAQEIKISREVTLAARNTGSPHVEDRDSRRKNGVVLDPEPLSDVLKGTEEVYPSRLAPKQDGFEGGMTVLKDVVIHNEVVKVSQSPVCRGIYRKDSASSFSGSLTGDHASLDHSEVESRVREGDRNGVDRDSSEKGVKGSQVASLRRSTKPVDKILGSSSNGDRDTCREKGAVRSSSRFRRSRAHSTKEETDQCEGDMDQVFEDQGSSALKNMPVEVRVALERQQYEDSVLAKAEDIHAKQEILDSSKKVPLKGKEPARCKTHWDFVLEEMVWLSKDFEKERKWKLSQAKKVAVRVSRSKLDIESKGLRRQKEEEQRTRRVASNIAKEVKKFWMKVEKLVTYKHQLQLEDRRKKALDKHLDFLLGQTERYSTMLAENLADIALAPVPKALPLVPFEGATATGEAETIVLEQNKSSVERGPVRESSDAGLEADIPEDQANNKAEKAYASGKLRSFEHENDIEKGFGGIVLKDAEVGQIGIDVVDEDFDLGNEADEEDDEATIAADEALITEDEKREELITLQRESELPLEELLKLYGRNGDDSDRADDDGEDSADEDSNEDEEEAEKETEKGSPLPHQLDSMSSALIHPSSAGGERLLGNCTGEVGGRNPVSEKPEASSHVVLDEVAAKFSLGGAHPVVEGHDFQEDGVKGALENLSMSVVSAERSSREGRCLTVDDTPEALVQDSQAVIDDGEYIPATLADGIEEDDETTLDEEELLASADTNDPTSEVNLLKRESEMTVEELLAQYRAMASRDGVEDSEGDEEACIEDRQDRTSEAGTSDSSDKDQEYGMDAFGYLEEAKERMGEPSTSGREQWSLLSSGYGRKLKKKKPMEKKLPMESNGYFSAEEKVSSNWNQKQVSSYLVAKNGSPEVQASTKGGMVASFLLQADEKMDADTMAAVARVSEAAKQRGERVLRRSMKGSMKEIESPSISPISAEQDGEQVATSSDEDMGTLSTGGHSNDVRKHIEGMKLVDASVEDFRVDDNDSKEVQPALDESLASPSAMREPGKSIVRRAPGSGGDEKLESLDDKTSGDRLADAAAEALSAQPTGYTFLTTKVRTKLPFLLKHTLREYQHIGLDWLVTMYEKRLNGILADEMGLGKTIMTISLLAHLACERGIWGPHLIVVPTSVMLNWETEFMKWCPAFKILTYFGSARDRKYKRQGWSKPNSFHVCITTYRLVIQDAKAFRRKKWKYLILDEAHLIKNWKSQRWQTLLNFNSKRRILLTGTPLQNDLMELWSLMHFLMPHVFQSHQEFRDWFSKPITGMVEGQVQINKEVVDRLHNVLRPFLLRRLKQDVEKQLPGKFEHVIRCRLSKRQRNLYEDFMANSDTQATLASGNFLGLLNVLMQLRKVCNHPDLFEGRPIISSFDMVGLSFHLSSLACSTLDLGPFSAVNLHELNLIFTNLELEMTSWECEDIAETCTPAALIEELSSTGEDSWGSQSGNKESSVCGPGLIEELQATLREKRAKEKKERLHALAWSNILRCSKKPVYGSDLRKCVLVEDPVLDVHKVEADRRRYFEFSSLIAEMVKTPLTRLNMLLGLVESFLFATPAARAPAPLAWCSRSTSSNVLEPTPLAAHVYEEVNTSLEPLRPVFVRRQLFFPDRRLLQFDCGKLQELAVLLRRLKSEGHRALIFTQMTRMLDVLEGFISLYGYTYMRLDGSTKPEQRQILMQRFNTNPKIFLFILSTRSGGVGINLVGADTVIFYDSDWNPAMDLQAQDRCHRIGQTREVHIYRLVSESTIEENILKKANQKRALDDLVIQSGSYNTEFFKKLDPMELFSGLKGVKADDGEKGLGGLQPQAVDPGKSSEHELSSAEVEAALKNAEDEADYMAMKRVEQEEAAENQEFTEEAFAGNMDDEDYADEVEEGKGVSVKPQVDAAVAGTFKDIMEGGNIVATTAEEVSQMGTALINADAEEEMDMLADVKQMAAAAAAAGRGSTSFEDQLQPVERYAMRFLELWDPRVDRASEAEQVLFEEKEWELDQLEKLKEEQEAEIDDDNEPLLYKSWNTEFANEAYRQQVEVLAQQQENQRQLEWEAMEEEMRDDPDRLGLEDSSAYIGAEGFKVKSKSLKKLKKAKFKSLMKGSLGSDELISLKAGGNKDGDYRDKQFELSSLPSRSPSQRKRKAPKLLEEEMLLEDYAKRMKRDHVKYRMVGEKGIYPRKSEFDPSSEASDDDSWPEAVDLEAGDLHSKSPTSLSAKKKPGEKISIMSWPLKKGPLITLEKERKRDAGRLQDHVPIAVPWTSAEDAILCAVVHEYGGNWQLASDVLAGVPDGSTYRGHHRHPLHCRERFRQLLAQIASASVDPSADRNVLNAATSSHFKVTEDHTKKLLEFVLHRPDDELLLQRHFAAVLTAVRNTWTRKEAGIDKPGASSGTIVNPPEGGGFISLLKIVHPHPSSLPSTPKRTYREKSSIEMELLVGKALNDGKIAEEPRPSIMEESICLQQGKEADNDSVMVKEDLDISKYLELEHSLPSPCNYNSGLSSFNNTPAFFPIEDLLGYKLLSASPIPPVDALRCYAENIADQRFRAAMNVGWGAGLYEWAEAAAYGLGVHSTLKVKAKKRQPPPDSSKPPKPKQAKMKASKRASLEVGVPAKTQPPTKKKKKVQSAVSVSPAVNKGNSVSGAAPRKTSKKNASYTDDRSSGLMQSTPGQISLQDPAEKTLADGSGDASRLQSKKSISSMPTSRSMAEVKRTKTKSIVLGGPREDSVSGQFTAHGALPSSQEAGSVRHILGENRLAGVEMMSPGGPSAVDDLSSDSDDEVVITGVSVSPALLPDVSPNLLSSTVKSILPGEIRLETPKDGRRQETAKPAQLDSISNMKSKDGVSIKVVGKTKSWPGTAQIARMAQGSQNQSRGSLSNLVTRVVGSSKTNNGVVGDLPSGTPSGGNHFRPDNGGLKESQSNVTWTPPMAMWTSPTTLNPSLHRGSSGRLVERVSSSAGLDVPPTDHDRNPSYIDSYPSLMANLSHEEVRGPLSGLDQPSSSFPVTYAQRSPESLEGSTMVEVGQHVLLQKGVEDVGVQLKSGLLSTPSSTGVVQHRSLNHDVLQRSSHPAKGHLLQNSGTDSSPCQLPRSGGKRLTLPEV